MHNQYTGINTGKINIKLGMMIVVNRVVSHLYFYGPVLVFNFPIMNS